ncbi:MAG: magnesium chelatase, partial [Bacteroidales bacterium]|nr:magnesium chelatase [Bacteroidales bacterium]
QLNKDEKAESSAAIRERVIAARAIQTARFANNPGVHCNAQMGSKLTRQYCTLTDECRTIMEQAMNRLGLSARAYDRILKVARTIADLEASPDITPDHLREAITYRSLDRDSWGK